MAEPITHEINWKKLLGQLNTCEVFFQPTKKLKPYIFPIMYGDLNHPEINSLLFRPFPSGYISLYIRFNTGLVVFEGKNLSKAYKPVFNFVAGVQKLENLHYIKSLGRVENFIVTFKPCGFSKLFGMPASCVQNQIVELKNLASNRILDQFNSLQGLPTVNEKAQKLITILTQMLNESQNRINNSITHSIDRILNSKGNILLKDICSDSRISTRSMQRAFLTHVGISPKEFIQIIRFNNVLGQILDHKFENWHQIINDYGYYDQAHFIHDFKAVTGYTPNEFMVNGHKAKSIYLDRFGLFKYEPQNIS